MITETGYTTLWTFTGGDPAVSSPTPALNLVNQNAYGGAQSFVINFTGRDSAGDAFTVAGVSGGIQDQSPVSKSGNVTLFLHHYVSSAGPYTSYVRFSETDGNIVAHRAGNGPVDPFELGTSGDPFKALYIGNSSSTSYKLFVDPSDGALKVANPSNVLTTLATP